MSTHTLAIDVGNTRIKLALFNGYNLMQTWLYNTFNAPDFETIIKQHAIERVILSNVTTNNLVADFLKQHTNVLMLEPTTAVPFKNLYASPNTLGTDRMALISAAVHEFKNTACLVISCGTCITYDVVNAQAEYLGGVISPGLHMRLNAMHHFTGKLPLVDLLEPTHIIGNSTETCLQHGAYTAALHEINGFIHQYQEVYKPLQVILTGGDAPLLAKRLKSNIFVAQNFLLNGLNIILQHNA